MISLAGRVEGLRVAEFSEWLMRQIDNGENDIVLDCTEVRFLAASVRRVLVAAVRRLASRKGMLKIAGLRPALLRFMVEPPGPDGPLPHYGCLADALNQA